MNSMEKHAGLLYPLLVVALIFFIIISVKTTVFIINILLFSLILTFLALPAVNWLKNKGLPYLAAVIIVTIIACLFVLALVLMTMYSVHVLTSDIPLYQAELNQRLTDITSILDRFGIPGSALMPASLNLASVIPVIYHLP